VNKELLFSIENLKTYFTVEGKDAKAVDGVTFDIYQGETLGLVGESGSGKSVTALSLMKLIPSPPGRIVDGKIMYRGQDIAQFTYEEMYAIRGKEIAMIFQEPMTSLNPVFPVGMQIEEVIMVHEGLNKTEARQRAIEMLTLVGIPAPEKRIDDYPHQFSGGMRQRVMIAIALACNPALLIADEPTTALDVTIQAQILELMLTLKEKRREAAILLITHDLAVVAELCNRVIVMYGGKIQEIATTDDLFAQPLHPYTRGLMNSIPHADHTGEKGQRLKAIPGNVPSILNFPQGCKFCTRCTEKQDICDTIEPPLVEIELGHFVRCHNVNTKIENGKRYE
jgi:oligopeptide/dipeptide ABC transporter ATP-binding protein